MPHTDGQAKILQWLTRVDPHSGRLYEAALTLREGGVLPYPGRFIAHVYREICIGLLNLYSSNEREELKPLLDRLNAEYRRLNLSRVSEVLEGSNPFAEGKDAQVVPRSFIESVEAVVAHHSSAPRIKSRAQAVFAAQASDPDPNNLGSSQTADRWLDMYNYFVRCAHNRTEDDAALMGEPFALTVTFFEETLLSFAEPAVGNLDALDAILEQANA